MILEARSTVKRFTGSAGRKILAKMTPRKRAKIWTCNYIVYLNDKNLFTKLNYIAFFPVGVSQSTTARQNC